MSSEYVGFQTDEQKWPRDWGENVDERYVVIPEGMSEGMSTYHILGHPDLTVEYDPENCPVCAGTLRDQPCLK